MRNASRTQLRNRQDAIQRLVDLIRKAAEKPRLRRRTKPPAGAKKRHLEAKQVRSRIKKQRRNVFSSPQWSRINSLTCKRRTHLPFQAPHGLPVPVYSPSISADGVLRKNSKVRPLNSDHVFLRNAQVVDSNHIR